LAADDAVVDSSAPSRKVDFADHTVEGATVHPILKKEQELEPRLKAAGKEAISAGLENVPIVGDLLSVGYDALRDKPYESAKGLALKGLENRSEALAKNLFSEAAETPIKVIKFLLIPYTTYKWHTKMREAGELAIEMRALKWEEYKTKLYLGEHARFDISDKVYLEDGTTYLNGAPIQRIQDHVEPPH
jgi:hypothetical protein